MNKSIPKILKGGIIVEMQIQQSWWQERRRVIREFLYGMFGMEISEHALEMRASLESIFMLATVGDMIGVPILPPYYSLRLLPFLIPNISVWKRRVLREKEFTDEHDYHLHGL